MMQNHTGHVSVDPMFQALRINMQDKICKWFERKYTNRSSEWKQRLPDIAKMLEESIFKESLNKDDYLSKFQSGIESRLITMQNQLNQKRQQQLQQQQLSRQQNRHQTMAHHNIQSNSLVSSMMIPTPGISHNPTGTMRMSSSMETNQGINPTSGPADEVSTDLARRFVGHFGTLSIASESIPQEEDDEEDLEEDDEENDEMDPNGGGEVPPN